MVVERANGVPQGDVKSDFFKPQRASWQQHSRAPSKHCQVYVIDRGERVQINVGMRWTSGRENVKERTARAANLGGLPVRNPTTMWCTSPDYLSHSAFLHAFLLLPLLYMHVHMSGSFDLTSGMLEHPRVAFICHR